MPHPITEVKKKRKDRGVIGQVKELAGDLVQKTALLKQLQEERDVLTAQHTILVSLCDSLYFLKENRVRELTAQAAGKEAQRGVQQQPDSVLQAALQRQRIHQEMLSSIEELLLLQQLAGIEYTGPHFRGANLPVLDLSADAYGAGQHQPISPDEDPFLLMRFISRHPPHAQALTWQLPDVMQHCSLSVPQLAMALAKLEAGLMDMGPGMSLDDGPCDSSDMSQEADGEDKGSNGTTSTGAAWVKRAGMGEHPIQTIQRIQIEWLQILGTLMDACKAFIVMKLPTTNFETGEVEKEPSKRRHMFTVRHLGLTQQQLQRFKVGFAVFHRLQGQLAEQQQQVQQQGVTLSGIQATLSTAATTTTTQPAPSGSSAPLASAAAAAVDFSASTGARLEAEQAAAAALNTILQKQRVIAGFQMFYIIGTLSWQQFAKLRVLMSPFTQFGPLLSACILEYAAEVDRQQQQQQSKAHAVKKPTGKKSAGSKAGDATGDGAGAEH